MLDDIEELAYKYCDGVCRAIWLVRADLNDYNYPPIKDICFEFNDFSHAITTLHKTVDKVLQYIPTAEIKKIINPNEIMFELHEKYMVTIYVTLALIPMFIRH